ncbi:ParA family protein [Candidatus Poribacteria bacterium]|nr:ParA family protein [Candidatus Poribacteria bacterium]
MTPVPVIAFFNNKGGVGKTSLVYHLAWMYARLGYRVLAADLDPQANLTAAFLNDQALEELWGGQGDATTIFRCVEPLYSRTGDIAETHLVLAPDGLGLLAGDLSLSRYEDTLAHEWNGCLSGDTGSFRVTSAFWRVIQQAASSLDACVALMDVGPNLGAINRSALVSADYVVVPLAPDLFSLQGLSNLGPTLDKWRQEWRARLSAWPSGKESLPLPLGSMAPLGYVVLQHAIRLDRPTQAYDRWAGRIPETYQRDVLGQGYDGVTLENDANCLALLKHYRSLAPLALEARKPMFDLKPADGAIGAHASAVRSVYDDFRSLAFTIRDRVGLRSLEAWHRPPHGAGVRDPVDA